MIQYTHEERAQVLALAHIIHDTFAGKYTRKVVLTTLFSLIGADLSVTPADIFDDSVKVASLLFIQTLRDARAMNGMSEEELKAQAAEIREQMLAKLN